MHIKVVCILHVIFLAFIESYQFKNTLCYRNNRRYHKDLYSVKTALATEEFGVVFDLEGNPSKKLSIIEENSVTNFDESDRYSPIKFNSEKDQDRKKLSEKLKRDKKDIDNSFSNLNSMINTIDDSLHTSSSSLSLSSSNQQCLQPEQTKRTHNSESLSIPQQIQSSSQSESITNQNSESISQNRHDFKSSTNTDEISGFLISYEKQKSGIDIHTEIQNSIQETISSKLNIKLRPVFAGIIAIAVVAGGILWQCPNILASIFLTTGGEAVTATVATSTIATVNTINISPTLLYAGLSL